MKAFATGLLAAGFALLGIAYAFALDAYPASDPRSVVQTVVVLTDKHALPAWSEPTFTTKLRPYLTADFLAVVARGARIAEKKGINLYDGEFFTGSQDLAHAKLFSAEVSKLAGDSAIVEASIGTTDLPNGEPTSGAHIRFQLKRVGGAWRIDDFRDLEDYAKSQPSIKMLFGDPVRYGQ